MGMIVGTAAYMAPEQARGKAVDKRADIWAFGVILFEMLSGKRLFEGDTISDVLAAVLRADIDWRALPASVPSEVRRLLVRCLDREPKNRLHDIADARIVIDETLRGGSTIVEAPAQIRRAPALADRTALGGGGARHCHGESESPGAPGTVLPRSFDRYRRSGSCCLPSIS